MKTTSSVCIWMYSMISNCFDLNPRYFSLLIFSKLFFFGIKCIFDFHFTSCWCVSECILRLLIALMLTPGISHNWFFQKYFSLGLSLYLISLLLDTRGKGGIRYASAIKYMGLQSKSICLFLLSAIWFGWTGHSYQFEENIEWVLQT